MAGKSLGQVFVEVAADTRAFRDQLSAGIQGVTGELSSSLAGITSLEDRIASGMREAGQSTVNVGKSLSRNVTAPLVGVATAALMTGMRFDDQMAKVQAISGATGDDLARLRAQAQEMGSTTRFSASEAAQGMEYLALAGFDTTEIMSAMPDLLSLAAASAMDLGRASDIVSDTMSAFRMGADEAGRAADIFAKQSSMSNTNVEQLGEAMKMAAPAAAAVGMDLESTAAILGVFADSGIKGSMAGTTLNGIFRDLIQSAEDGAVAIGDTAVAVFDAEGQFRPLEDIMAEVAGATEGMSDAMRENELRAIFGAQSIRGVNLMLGEGAETFARYSAANRESSGTAAEMASIMEDTLGGGFRALKSQMEGIMIQLSDVLVPVIREHVVPAVQRFGEFVSGLVERFNELEPRQQKIIGAVVAFAVAIGPVLVVVGTLMKVLALAVKPIMMVVKGIKIAIAVVKGIMVVFKALTVLLAANPFTLIVIAIVAVIALIWKFREQIMEAITKAWEWVKEKFEALKEWVVGIISSLVETVVGWWNSLKEWVVEAVTGMVDMLVGAVTWLWDKYVEIWTAIFDAIRNVVTSVRDFLVNIWTTIRDTVVRVVTGLWDRIVNAFRAAWNFYRDTAIRIRDFVRDAFNAMKDRVVEAVQNLWDGAVERFTNLVDWVRGLPRRILDALGNVANMLKDAGKNILQGLWDGMKEVWDRLTGWVGGLGDRIRNLKGPLSYDRVMLTDIGEAIIGGLGRGMEKEWDSVERLLSGMTATIPVTAEAGAFDQMRGSIGGQSRGGVNVQMTINNPLPETAADSASREMRKLAAIGVFGD